MSCPHMMPSPASCLACMEDDGLGAPPVPPVTVEYTFTGDYIGWCKECDDTINIGQRIAKMSDGTYRHATCARPRLKGAV